MRDLTAEAGTAWAGVEQRFNPFHSSTGQFASSAGQGAGAGQTQNTKKKNAQRKQTLRHQAQQDREQAHRLEEQLHQLEHQIHKAAAATAKSHVSQAKSNAAKKAAVHRTTTPKKGPPTKANSGKTGDGGQQGSVSKGRSLQQQAAGLRNRIDNLLTQAKKLDAQAAKL